MFIYHLLIFVGFLITFVALNVAVEKKEQSVF